MAEPVEHLAELTASRDRDLLVPGADPVWSDLTRCRAWPTTRTVPAR